MFVSLEEAAEEPIQVHVEEKPAGGSEEDSLRELLNSNETVMDNNGTVHNTCCIYSNPPTNRDEK